VAVVVVVVMAIAIVIVIVPVAVGVPAIAFNVPPLVFVGIAPLASFVEFVARVFGLFAFPAVVFCGFVELMIGFDEAAPASAFIIGAERRCAREKKSARQDCGRKRACSPK
jgi:hypothetical protein